jgi:hypothetical protein
MKSQLIGLAVLIVSSAWAQTPGDQTKISDCPSLGSQSAQAVQVLQESLTATGGMNVVQQIQDFVATGSITFYWGGKQVQGRATIRVRGGDQFRLDASLPGGTRSWLVSHGGGALKDTDGTITIEPWSHQKS